MARGGGGLAGEVRNIASDVLRMLRTRLELLAIEVQREKALAVRQLIAACATLFLLSFGMLLAILGLAFSLPEGQRPAALGILGAAFLVAGAVGALRLFRGHPGMPLAATIGTLGRDEEMLQRREAAIPEARGSDRRPPMASPLATNGGDD